MQIYRIVDTFVFCLEESGTELYWGWCCKKVNLSGIIPVLCRRVPVGFGLVHSGQKKAELRCLWAE